MCAQYDVPFSRVQLFEQRLADPATWREPELVFVGQHGRPPAPGGA